MRNNSQSNGKEKQNTETENDIDFNVETRTGKNPGDSTIHKKVVSRAFMTSFINPLYVWFLLF